MHFRLSLIALLMAGMLVYASCLTAHGAGSSVVVNTVTPANALRFPVDQLKTLASAHQWTNWFEKAPVAPLSATPLNLPLDLLLRQLTPSQPFTPHFVPHGSMSR